LHEDSRLNPFILALLSKGKGRHLEGTPYVAYQFQPDEAQLIGIEANEEEKIFIHFVQQQLELSSYFLFYCVGWSEEDITESKALKKLAKYFKKMCCLSTVRCFRWFMTCTEIKITKRKDALIKFVLVMFCTRLNHPSSLSPCLDAF
jgi:hypothetical protein